MKNLNLKMDFKTLVNKESFKVILLHHLKNQVRTKYSHIVSNKVQESLDKDDTLSSNHIVSSVSSDILQSPNFSQFESSFLEDINVLFEDKERYVPKQDKHRNSSQCSSASSVNASSIDFLSPDQFQSVTQSLANGTNAEKLEALGLLHRLPTLEHLTHHFLWTDVESGVHNALSSPIVFLRAQSLRFYIKMLTCAEPKVVQESYQSLIKYFLQVLLPSVHESSMEQTRCRCAVEIISILNKFLQSISTHWLRYPQSMIENITSQSLSILSNSAKSEFPVWMCIALCDPEARWLKSLLHGHISRASLVNALRENLDILSYAVDMCDKFSSDEKCLALDETCCEKPYLVTEITHALCFLSHLLEYTEGRQTFNASSSWPSVLGAVMNCVRKLCNTACFSCCSVACEVVSRKWLYFWSDEDSNTTNEHLVQILASNLNNEDESLNMLYFRIRCFCESYGGMDNVVHSLELQSHIDNFFLKLLKQCLDLSIDGEETMLAIIHVFNSSLILLKIVCLTPSTLFTNCAFIEILSRWLLKVKEFSSINSTNSNFNLLQREKLNIVLETDKNILDVSICFLHKPIRSTLCPDDYAYEAGLNILLEKVLGDIKAGNSVCPLDISVLSRSLSRSTGTKFVLNKTFVFRLSSIIWQLKGRHNDMDDLQSMKFILEALLPSIFSDLPLLEALEDTNTIPEAYILQHVLLFPNASSKNVEAEEYNLLSLQIISLLCASIHSLCLLESEFMLSEFILKQQSQLMTIDDGKPVIDPVSVLQNLILVKLYTLGGPGERILPCEILEGNDDYVWPFVKEYPVPEIFLPSVNEESNDSSFSDEPQNEDLKLIFSSHLQSDRKLSPSLVSQLLENSINTLQSETNFLKVTEFKALDASDCVLHNTEKVGLEMVKRYGIHLNLIPLSDDEEHERLLKASKSLFKSTDSNRLDIFVCSIYLMCRGNIDIAWLFLQNFSKCNASLYVWKEYLVYASENFSGSWATLQSTIYELCDIIVKKALPRVFSALQFRGILPSVIFDYWTSQCYWNYLDFAEISHFILLNVLYCGEFTLYFFVAILKHLRGFILENAHNCELFGMLIKNPIKDFALCKHIDYLMELSDKFHLTISKQMENILH